MPITSNDKLTIGLGALVSILAFIATFNYEIEKNRLYFQSSAIETFNKIESVFSTLKRVNSEIGSRFYLSNEVDKDEFSFFAKSHIAQNPFIERIFFAEKVLKKDQTQYELKLRDAGYSGFSIKPFPGSAFTDSIIPGVFFPVKYIEPYNVKNSQWFGRDTLTYPSIHKALQETKKYPSLLTYTPANSDRTRLYGVRSLYAGNFDHPNGKSLEDVFGILLYDINMKGLIPQKASDSLTILVNNTPVLHQHAPHVSNLFNKIFKSTREIDLINQKVVIEVQRIQNLFSINFVFPAIVLFIGLFLTAFVWHIIRSHIEINQLLSRQKKTIEDEVHIKTNELREKADELSSAYQRQLELTDELKAFCYSVSHDLRAPLRSINGFSQILQDDHGDALNAEAKSYLLRTCTAAEKMGNIIDDLLNLSQITRSNLKRQQISMSEIAEKTAQTMREYEPNRQVLIDIQKDVTAHGDPRLLQIVFDNLIGNAWKYSKNTPQAHIEFGVTQQQGEPVYFIRDNGSGFDMRYKDKLFTAFQRLHHASEFEGSGIGLATVQRIIQKHNGRIWASSEPDKGATFYFTLGAA